MGLIHTNAYVCKTVLDSTSLESDTRSGRTALLKSEDLGCGHPMKKTTSAHETTTRFIEDSFKRQILADIDIQLRSDLLSESRFKT